MLTGRRPTAHLLARQTVGQLRSEKTSATVIADRCEAEGLRAHLAGDRATTRERLTTALTLHRRAGNSARRDCGRAPSLGGCMTAGTPRPKRCAAWILVAGNSQAAERSADAVGWDEVSGFARLEGPLWERAASRRGACRQRSADRERGGDEARAELDRRRAGADRHFRVRNRPRERARRWPRSSRRSATANSTRHSRFSGSRQRPRTHRRPARQRVG